MATKETTRVDYSLRIQEKETWFSASISPISDRLVVWVAYNLTERQQTQRALRESQEPWQLALEAAASKFKLS